jgi:RNA polymerase sigma-70 factor (sigma-E family)
MTGSATFREFVEAGSSELQRLAWVLTGNWSSAQDRVQDALIAAWPHWGALSRPDAPQLYVRRIMITSFVRGRRRRWVGELPTAVLPETPTGECEDVELRHTLLSALARLPARQRSAVALRYFVDLSEADTADALGCSIGTVKAHWAKAMVSLRKDPGLVDLLKEGVR